MSEDVTPSPKFHAQPVADTEVASLNCTTEPGQAGTGPKVKLGIGGPTVMDWKADFDPHGFDDVSAIVYAPPAAYAWFGFCAVDVVPSPKSHCHEVASVEVSVNWIAELMHGAPVTVKEAVGEEGRTVTTWLVDADPSASETVRVTV